MKQRRIFFSLRKIKERNQKIKIRKTCKRERERGREIKTWSDLEFIRKYVLLMKNSASRCRDDLADSDR